MSSNSSAMYRRGSRVANLFFVRSGPLRKIEIASKTLRPREPDRQRSRRLRSTSFDTSRRPLVSPDMKGVFLERALLSIALPGSSWNTFGVIHLNPRTKCTEGSWYGSFRRHKSRRRWHIGRNILSHSSASALVSSFHFVGERTMCE